MSDGPVASADAARLSPESAQLCSFYLLSLSSLTHSLPPALIPTALPVRLASYLTSGGRSIFRAPADLPMYEHDDALIAAAAAKMNGDRRAGEMEAGCRSGLGREGKELKS